jgi:hypothetical protein
MMSRGARIIRGMVGMGAIFGLIGAAFVAALATWGLIFSPRVDRTDIPFMMVGTFIWFGIACGIGMAYAGLLSFLARGRSLRQLSILRVAAAGAVVGLLLAVVVYLSSGNVHGELEALALFPPLSAIVATVTLLIARRAKAEPIAEPVDDA